MKQFQNQPNKPHKPAEWYIVLLCIALLAGGSCKEAMYAPVKEDTIRLSANPIAIKPGKESTITVTGVKANGRPMPDNTVVILSADSGAFRDQEEKKTVALLLISGMGTITYKADDPFTGEAVTITANAGTAAVIPEQLVIGIGTKVVNVPPVAAFTFSPKNPRPGDTIYFNAEASSDPDGNIKEYHWDFGDGKKIDSLQSHLTDHEYTPSVTTTYTVTLRVVDDKEADGVVSNEVTVAVKEDKNQPPTAAFSFSPKNPRAGETVRFNAEASTDPDSDEPLDYEWDFGVGTPLDTSSGKMAECIYDVTEEKTLTVTLKVIDIAGAEGIATAEITVRPSPVARFTFSPSEPMVDEYVTFDASTSEGDIETYRWYFGDGGKTTIKSTGIMHQYKNKGSFTVTLTVTDENKRQSVFSVKLKVQEKVNLVGQ